MTRSGVRQATPALYAVGGMAVFLVVWEFAAVVGLVDRFASSSPTEIIADVPAAFGKDELARDVWVTVQEWFTGFLLATLVGVPIGAVAAMTDWRGPLVENWLKFLLVVPMVAFVPVIIVWVGIGFELKALIAFLTALPMVAFNTMDGLRNLPPEYRELATTFRTRRLRRFFQVMLPGALPSIIAGVRIGAGQALVGVIFAEMTASTEGIGTVLRTAAGTYDAPRLLLAVIVLGLVAMAVGKALEFAERRATFS